MSDPVKVQLVKVPDGKTYAWQLQHLDGTPVGVGLFVSEGWGAAWCRTNGLVMVTTAEAREVAR